MAEIAAILCRHVEAMAPGVTCSVLSVDDGGRMHTLASPGLPREFLDALEGLPIGPDVGSCGACAFLNEAVEIVDMDSDLRWSPYKELPMAAGLRACSSMPVRGRDGRVVGTFALYFREKRASSAFEREVVDTCVHLCALAMEHEEVWTQLEHTNKRFDAALTNMSQGLCFFNGERRLIVANGRYSEIYDLPPGRIVPGVSLEQIVEMRVAAGSAPRMDVEAYLDWRGTVQVHNEPLDSVVELQNGRVIAIHHRPMPDFGWVATHEDITERRRAEERLAHLARHDPLTGLLNRTVFHERLAEVLAQPGAACAVLCLDLDHFKAVNDAYGHLAGDAVLRGVATRLSAFVRDGDAVTRLGGDEFVLLCNGVDTPEQAGMIAARVIESLDQPFELEGQSVTVGASLGVAVAPRDGNDAGTLMKCADTALHRTKVDEAGSYRSFEPAMDSQRLARVALERDLRQAVQERQFELAYQPLIDLPSGTVCSFEALLRWRHPGRGPVSPADFIPVAEETGLIVGLGAWVLRTACAEAAKWPGAVKVAVNLSATQFRNRALLGTVHQALAASGLSAGRLELEITESVLLHNSAETLQTLHELRALGIGISLDDFGTGYSSLSYLRSFPFNKIKIDQSFIRELSDRPESLAIIRAVVGLGRSLGMRTTAEGVETEEQFDRVRREGCTEVQGYLFSRPTTAEAAREVAAGAPLGRGLL